MASGSRVAISVTGIALGITTIIGGLAGTLAAALAGLFDPYILVPPTSTSLGLPPLVPPFNNEPENPPQSPQQPILPPGQEPTLPPLPELGPGGGIPALGPGEESFGTGGGLAGLA